MDRTVCRNRGIVSFFSSSQDVGESSPGSSEISWFSGGKELPTPRTPAPYGLMRGVDNSPIIKDLDLLLTLSPDLYENNSLFGQLLRNLFPGQPRNPVELIHANEFCASHDAMCSERCERGTIHP